MIKDLVLAIGGIVLAGALVLNAFGASLDNITARGRAMVSTLPAMLK